MKRLQSLEEALQINKNKLNEYLSEFEPSVIPEYLNLFSELDFKSGCSSFIEKMNKKIGMPKIGKHTIRYWISRGWSKEEAENLRTKIKKSPITSPMNIDHWVNKGYSKEEAIFKVKSQRKMNIEYWINKGYSKEEAELKRTEYQKRSNSKFLIKYKTQPEFKIEVDSKKSNTLIYWTSRGYNKSDAKKMQSNRQSTFSKDICIEKYGFENGIRIWKDRQERWINSLEASEYDLVSGKSVSIDDKIEKYDIDRLINSLTIKNREFFKGILSKSDSIEEFINNYMSRFDVDELSLYRILLPIKRMKLLHSYYNTSESYIMTLIIPKLTRIKSSYSYISWFNNHICRSDSEYILANFLVGNDIDYIYEKRYNNSKYKCDFYLTKYDIYIEFLGMKMESYKNKLEFLNRNNIKHISSNDIEYIKNKVKEYVNSKDR
jgi:hypothetical protein